MIINNQNIVKNKISNLKLKKKKKNQELIHCCLLNMKLKQMWNWRGFFFHAQTMIKCISFNTLGNFLLIM